MHIDIDRDAERLLTVLFIGDTDIDELHEILHYLGRRLAVLPELASEIEVARDRHTGSFGRLAGLEREVRGRLRQRRRDARNMKPLGILEYISPIKIPGSTFRDSRMCPVVYDLAGPLVCATLQELYAHPITRPTDIADINAEAAHFADTRFRNIVARQRRHERRIESVVGERHRHVGLAAAERRFERRRLEETLMSGRLEPQHDLAK